MNSGQPKLSPAALYHRGSSYPARATLASPPWKSNPAIYKRFPGKPWLPLPTALPEDGPTVLEAAAKWRAGSRRLATTIMSLEDLSILLFHTQGISQVVAVPGGKYELRAAPSAGALYPVDLYVAPNRIDGLEPGLYHYGVRKHRLAKLADGNLYSRLETASGSPHLFQPSAATVLFAVTFARSGHKYRERCYRYVNMDAGHAAFNLATCAAALDYAAPIIARFDDAGVNTLLGINPKAAAALMIVPLGRPLGRQIAPPFPEPAFTRAAAGSTPRLRGRFLDIIHGGTSLTREDSWVDPPVRTPPGDPPLPALTEPITLPDPVHGLELYPAIRKRRSLRAHTMTPLRRAELSSLCTAAAGSGSTGEPFLSIAPPISLYVVIRDVEGVPPGVHLFDPASRGLQQVRPGDLSRECGAACLDQDFCRTASALFVKTVRFDQLARPDGDRGYRYACILSGIMGEGIYLQATALGLAACGVGAFLDEQLAKVIGCDPDEEAVLYATAVGR